MAPTAPTQDMSFVARCMVFASLKCLRQPVGGPLATYVTGIGDESAARTSL